MRVVRLGVRAAVQPIPIDTDVKYRVRIGAINRLDELNRIRAVLQRSGIYAEPIRVGE
jgi:cell division septation protein DedD